MVRGSVVEGDGLDSRGEAGEVGTYLDRLEVADDEQRRSAEVILVAEHLEVGGLQVLVLALVCASSAKWIAATALALRVPVVTLHEDDADTPGLEVIQV